MNVLERQKHAGSSGTSLLDDQVQSQDKLDGGLVLKVIKNKPSDRIFVEFSSPDGKLVLQRSYQDNITGRTQAETFKSTIKSLDDLKRYFRIIK